MRIFLAGASGVIGVQLVPLLVSSGHDVAGMTRSPQKTALLAELGAEPVVCDVFDAAALQAAVTAYAPDVVMHQLTDLPDDLAELPGRLAANARIRRDGTRNLLDAARAAGNPRVLAQSVAWDLPGEGGLAKGFLERSVLEAGGIVFRYGQFYGPGTYQPDGPSPDDPPGTPRVHVAEAARRTAAALDAPSGIITVTDAPAG
jgi:nucleoside-diphosphate-sugar epimerase